MVSRIKCKKKCGVMLIRKRGVRKTEEVLEVDGKRIEVVEEFKYLDCVVTEQMGSKRMVEESAQAGSRALSDYLRKCRDAAGAVRGRTFVYKANGDAGWVSVAVWGRGVGWGRSTGASRKGVNASGQDFPRGREVAPPSVLTI